MKGSRATYRVSTAAAGFVAGFAVTVMLFASHQKHSEAHADVSSRELPGQLPDAAAVAAAVAARQRSRAHTAWAGGAAARPPPPPRRELRLPDLNTTTRLLVGFGNSAYLDLVRNWVASVEALPDTPFLVASLDEEMLAQCKQLRLPCVPVKRGMGAAYFREDVAAFRKMGAIKLRFVLGLLEQHPSLQLLFLSDSDVVWLRPPWTYLQHRASADFFVSTDCLSVQVEDDWRPNHGFGRCGHIPGNAHGRAFNTGMFAARNTRAARAFLRAWADMLDDPAKAKHEQFEINIDDQFALNLLFDKGGIVGAGEDMPRHILVFDRSMVAQPLPAVLFANGHVAFVQRLPWRRGVSPIAIHATFLRHPVGSIKRHRLREFGFWHLDPPAYYGQVPPELEGAPGRLAATGEFALKLLTYGGEGEVHAFVAAAERARYGGAHRMPLLEKHWLGMSYQLAAFRDALGAARVLGRTVLLPTLWCWCDWSESPDVMVACRSQGSDVRMPYECPLDFLLPADSLENVGVEYRAPGFLARPQVPVTLRKSRAAVVIARERPAEPFPRPSHTVGHAVTAWPGIKQGELLRVVEPVKREAVLQLRGEVPGFFGGMDDPGATAAFDQLFRQAVDDYGLPPYWCCMSWGDSDLDEKRQLKYALPRPLADGWQPWQPPRLDVPPWCDAVSTKHNNHLFLLLPQHPCAFTRNDTLRAEAAAAGDYSRPGAPGVAWAQHAAVGVGEAPSLAGGTAGQDLGAGQAAAAASQAVAGG